MKPVCLVTGVGQEHGTGAEIARRFSFDYHVAFLARNAANIEDLVEKHSGKAYPTDVGDLEALVETMDRIMADIVLLKIVIQNAPCATRGPLLGQDPTELEQNFRVNTTALLYLEQHSIPGVLDAGDGAILVTGNTSATRGKAHWGFFAWTKAAQRILRESIAHDFGPKGIHVACFHDRRGHQHPTYPATSGPRCAG